MPEEVKKFLIGDLAGLSEALKKLVEVVSSGLGRITGSVWLDKRDADNKAYEILKVGGAQTQVAIDRMKAVAALGSGSTPQVQKLTLAGNEVNAELSNEQQVISALKERSDNRTEYQNLLHQLNTENVVGFAAEELRKENKTVSEEPVDLDWIARFFNIIKDVSSEEAQLLWGKVLSGEIEKPNTFSLRTLDVLRNLSKKEAQIFQEACNYIVAYKAGDSTIEGSLIVKRINGRNELHVYEDFGFLKVSSLMECGLLQPIYNASLTLSKIGVRVNYVWRIADKAITFSGIANAESHVPIIPLTIAGFEISKLVTAKASIGYIKHISEILDGTGLKAHYATFKKWSDEMNAEVEDDSIPL